MKEKTNNIIGLSIFCVIAVTVIVHLIMPSTPIGLAFRSSSVIERIIGTILFAIAGYNFYRLSKDEIGDGGWKNVLIILAMAILVVFGILCWLNFYNSFDAIKQL